MHYHFLTGRQIIFKMRHFKNEDRETSFNHPGHLLRDFQHHLIVRHHRECIRNDDYFSKVYNIQCRCSQNIGFKSECLFADGIIDD